MNMPDGETRALFEFFGSKVRWDLIPSDPSAGYRLYDAAARRMFTVDLSAPSIVASDLAPSPGAASTGGAAWTFTRLGQGNIAGHACERLRVTRGASSYDVCAAGDMAPVPLGEVFPATPTAVPFLEALEARGAAMPLAVSVSDGAPTSRLASPQKLLTMQLRQGPLDHARFDLPPIPVTQVKRTGLPRVLPR